MKLIAIEEHFPTKAVRNEWQKNVVNDDPTQNLHLGKVETLLEDMGKTRLELMDETGIDVQVLSLTSPSLHNLGVESIRLAKQTNDYIAEIVKKIQTDFKHLQLYQCLNQRKLPGNWIVL